MSDFLLELRSEEIPARMQAGARADLEKLFRKELAAAGVAVGEVTVWSTPRRLALIARGLPDATAAVSEELKGPRVGAPPQAIEGFLRKTGLSEGQLTERDGVLYAVTEKSGRATADVLAEAIPAIIRAFPWPKSQRWGAASLSSESLRWVRPLSGIVAILGKELVSVDLDVLHIYQNAAGAITTKPERIGLKSSRETLGHRFHSSGPIEIDGADDYAAKLRAAHVIVDHEERQDFIREHAIAAAHAAGLVLVADEGLVVENAGLTEWPVPLLGRFDEAFLDVPPEVIQLTARTNQKYFICRERTPEGAEQGQLANAFICTANIVATDGGAAIVDGNRKVLAARLADARFFWEQDRKKTLAQHAEGLARITFHEKLGTLADKVERVAKLARWLVEEGIVSETPLPEGEGLGVGGPTSRASNTHPQPLPSREGASLADQAELAARLCKADLVTAMVGEFPELQGVIGGYYAADEGLPQAVADAIRDHYKPVGQGDDVPTAPVTVAVSLADKLDTLFQFFMAGLAPTGSKDPFALRRAALGVLGIVQSNRLRLPLEKLIERAYRELISNWRANDALACLSDGKVPYDYEDAGTGWLIFPDPIYENSDLYAEPDFKFLLLVEYYGYDDTREIHDFDLDGNRVLEFVRFTKFREDFLAFFADRLKVQQREAGVRHDLIDAVFALGGEDDLVRLLARVHALQAFTGTEDGTNLLAGYKRAANILKKEGFTAPLPGGEGPGVGVPPLASNPHPNPSPTGKGFEEELSDTPEPAEKALIEALDLAAPRAAQAVSDERFGDAMAALATLRAPIDAFFDNVTVNDPAPTKRIARLSLLARFRDAVHGVADFSKIDG